MKNCQTIREQEAPPIRKAREFLALSRKMRGLGTHLMDLGFRSHRQHQDRQKRRFWAAAANFFGFAKTAREEAQAVLNGAPAKLSFGYSPRPYADPGWEPNANASDR
ncbi:MAG: hypothetical protein JST40_00930 [Armatimonadetes bacterium]|nr:hypothetical protein [Armatimonadota bacterium]